MDKQFDVEAVIAGLSEVERKIILASKAPSETDFPYLTFKHLSRRIGGDANEVPVACRRLRKLGILGFESGLRSDEGEFYGSGYALCDANGLAVRERLSRLSTGEG